jgi:ABC-type antimicrobial peptide transport system permease subunit
MSIQAHLHDNAPGVIGTSLTGGFTVAGFVSDSLPELQVISLLIGIAVGVVTFIYYAKKISRLADKDE